LAPAFVGFERATGYFEAGQLRSRHLLEVLSSKICQKIRSGDEFAPSGGIFGAEVVP
jgi:hypothetical protein